MSFGSFEEFLAMGGHGLYVWLSYGAAVIIVLYNMISVRLAQRRFYQDARDRERRHGPSPDLPMDETPRGASTRP